MNKPTMDDQARVNVAILGCGLIGTQWDAAAQSPDFSLTHAAGFTRNPACRLAAVCDQDLHKADQAALRWGGKAYDDPQQLFAQERIDLAVVATSSAARWAVIEPALAARVRVLVIEKPLATTLTESRKLCAAITNSGTRSLVNFSRHWDPSMRRLAESIKAGEFGRIQRLVGSYGKGITNNGSHMIDLAALLCAAIPVRARCLGSPLPASEADWSGGKDRALDAQIVFVDDQGAEFYLNMLGTDQNAFTCFELRVIGTRRVSDLTLGGRRITQSSVTADPHYAGYAILGEPLNQPARAMEAMDWMVEEALELARGTRDKASCDVHSALLTALSVEAVTQSAREDGRWIEIG